jgi:hypothetical protein
LHGHRSDTEGQVQLCAEYLGVHIKVGHVDEDAWVDFDGVEG